MRKTATTAFALLACFGLAGCGAGAGEEGDLAVADDATGDSTASTSTYFTIKPVDRDCTTPSCAHYVTPVNKATVVCPDGARRTTCYVYAVDYRATGIPENATVDLARGKI